MSDEGYTTPEGHRLYRPLLLPNVLDFNDILVYVREWDYATMNHRNGVIPRPELVPDSTGVDGVEIQPFCHIKSDRDGRRPIAATPTLATLDALRGQLSFDERVSFEIIEHARTGRALVIAHGNIGTRYVAYIDPATIPAKEG